MSLPQDAVDGRGCTRCTRLKKKHFLLSLGMGLLFWAEALSHMKLEKESRIIISFRVLEVWTNDVTAAQ